MFATRFSVVCDRWGTLVVVWFLRGLRLWLGLGLARLLGPCGQRDRHLVFCLPFFGVFLC